MFPVVRVIIMYTYPMASQHLRTIGKAVLSLLVGLVRVLTPLRLQTNTMAILPLQILLM